jgi:uncharacterized protein YggT (Ycf19 family)
MIHDNLGSNMVLLYKYIDLMFILVFIYYLYSVFQYTRYLVNEKCKCSADIRREIIMIGSLIEFGLIFILFLLHIIAFTIFAVIYSVVSQVNEGSGNVRSVIRDPIGSLSKVPKTLKTEMSNINSYLSKTGTELRKIGSRKGTK